MSAEAFYKILGPDREAIHGGTGVWPAPGEWLRVKGDLVPCRNGLHVCRARDLAHWVEEGAWVWRVEVDAQYKQVLDPEKVVVRCARLVEPVGVLTARVLRLFAADCAESVAHLHGHDPRCMDAIRVARLSAHGLASREELAAAGAADAARGAAWAAAWAAARAAARAADAARGAAWAAARGAARAADAAGDAARDAQGENLLVLAARYGRVTA